jgi:CheY-like chemotaxis protein
MAHILIVDDDDLVRRALELAVARMGHEPESASSGGVALTCLQARRPDLALVDVTMPGMDGLELVERMQEELGERCPPVIFVSAVPPEDAAVVGRPLDRVVAHVKKPFLLDELFRAIRGALG